LTLTALTAALTAPVLAQGTRLSELTGGFSYTVPAGWQIKTFPGLKYKICHTTSSAGFAPNITIIDEVTNVPLDTYMKASLGPMRKVYRNLHVVSTTPFSAAAGLVGRRMAVTGILSGKSLSQVFYIPSGRKPLRLVPGDECRLAFPKARYSGFSGIISAVVS